MTRESISHPSLRSVLPFLQRRSHVIRRPTQGKGRSRAAASWSSMPVSHAPSASDEFVSGRPRPTSFFAAETSPPLPVPSATFEIVSAMPECLQSRPKPTSLDLPAWVDNTNRHTIQSPGGIVDDEMIPWMQLPQPEFSGINKAQYRETPLYSEPGSPDLTRAYATEEVQCPQPRPRIPSWATFGFAGDSYPGFEVPASLSRGSLAGSDARNGSSYYGDASEDERASVLSRRSSGLSIMCQGHSALELSPLAFGQAAAQPVEENTLPKSTGCEFMDWAENESSGRSSMCYSERAYEEFATPLAPAKARIVHISGDFSQFPTRTTSLFQRDSCEPSPTKVSMLDVATRNLHPTSAPDTPSYSPKSFPRPFTPYHHNDIFTHTPPLTPVSLLAPPTRPPPAAPTPPSPLEIHSNPTARLRQRTHVWGSSASEMSAEIVNDIYAATRHSNIKNLTLEYPVVVVIRSARRRWRTYDGWYTNPAASLGDMDSLSTSMICSSRGQSPMPSPRPSLFPPSEVGSKDTENEAVWSQGLMTRTVTPITDLDSEVEYAEGRLPEADLGALRRIFPDSDPKWYGILYAHIVCYNYVLDLEKGPSFEHLEASERGEGDWRDDADESVRLGLIMRTLEYCVSRIICRMRGQSGRRADKKAGNELKESHLLLTRSLSTFIRSCEASIM